MKKDAFQSASIGATGRVRTWRTTTIGGAVISLGLVASACSPIVSFNEVPSCPLSALDPDGHADLNKCQGSTQYQADYGSGLDRAFSPHLLVNAKDERIVVDSDTGKPVRDSKTGKVKTFTVFDGSSASVPKGNTIALSQAIELGKLGVGVWGNLIEKNIADSDAKIANATTTAANTQQLVGGGGSGGGSLATNTAGSNAINGNHDFIQENFGASANGLTSGSTFQAGRGTWGSSTPTSQPAPI